jgi:FG-GAP-like repeat
MCVRQPLNSQTIGLRVPRWKRFTAGFGLLLATVLASGLAPTPASAQTNPNFCSVSDFVNNQYLVHADDLIALGIQKAGSNSLAITQWPIANTASPYSDQAFGAEQIPFMTTQCGSGFVDSINSLHSWTQRETLPMQSRVGRFFEVPHDHVVLVAPSAQATGQWCDQVANANDFPMDIYLLDGTQLEANNGTLTVVATTGINLTPRQMQIAVADFDGDGLDDIFLINQSAIWIFSATDPADPTKGFTQVATLSLPASIPGARNTPRVGDLDNDGNLDVAWISGGTQPAGQPLATPTAVFATICSGQSAVNSCGSQAFGIKLRQATVPMAAFPAAGTPPYSPSAASLVGNFDVNRPGDELALIQATPMGSRPARGCVLATWGFDAGLTTATPLAENDICNSLGLKLSGQNGFISSIYADNGAYNFYGSGDQIAVLLEECYGQSSSTDYNCYAPVNETHIAVFTPQSGASLEIGFAGQRTWTSNQFTAGLAFGRYGSTSDINSSSTAADFQLQTAVQDGPDFGVFQAADALTASYGPKQVFGFAGLVNFSVTEVNSGFQANLTGGSVIYPGDLLGRSQRLGPPEITRVAGHGQPTVVLGVPPMHYDAIDLAGGNNPAPVNFTAFTPGYSAKYNFDSTSSTSSSTTATTSWTQSTSETGSVGLQLGGLSAQNTETFQQSWSNTKSSMNYSSSSQSDEVTSTTVTADKILFRSNELSLYTYRLIGQTDCPASDPDCSPKQPAYVTFSGSELADGEAAFVPGSQVEWYQPVTQPGNVFTYPPTERLLEDRLPGGEPNNAPLATTDSFTTSGGQTATISLASQSGNSQTAGSTHNNSFDSSTSVGVKAFGAQAGGSFSYESSSANSTLNTSTNTLAASTGITINAAGPFLGASLNLYDYKVGPYLYGTFSQAPQKLTPGTEVATTGALSVLFTADPTAEGSWWTSPQSGYATYPDIALNHPTQWCVGSPQDCGATTTPLTDQCITMGATQNCAFFQAAGSEPSVWDNDFYSMKGLLILDSASNPVASVAANGPTGSQLANAVDGDVITLAARVYNLSLVPLSNDSVKVQFYYQAITDLTNHTLDPAGATLINTVQIPSNATTSGAIPPFCGAGSVGCDPASAPDNYAYAATTFDTTGFGGKNLTFWVVIWAEDATGKLLGELPEHGLSKLPATSSNPVNLTTAIAFEPYSNNIGFYRYVFPVVAEPADPCASEAAPAVSALSSPRRRTAHGLRRRRAGPFFSELTTSSKRVLPGEKVKVSAKLFSQDVDHDFVEVFFTDRHPGRNPSKPNSQSNRPPQDIASGRNFESNVFDYELLGRVGAGRETEARVTYRPKECGPHEIIARSGAETIKTYLTVSCAPKGPAAKQSPPKPGK